MKRIFSFLIIVLLVSHVISSNAQTFTFEQILKYPFPSELTASATGSKIAWAFNEQGKRNIYVAEGPEFKPRKLTSFNEDDGQEITSLSVSNDGKWVVFVKGGEHGANWNDSKVINPASSAIALKVEVWVVPFAGGEVKMLSDGDYPVISPKSDRIVFIKSDQIWQSSLDGSSPAKIFIESRGTSSSLKWSPDGSGLAYVSSRGDHSFIGIYNVNQTSVKWIAPSFSRDNSPRWSPDGKKVTFVRTPGSGGNPDSILVRKHQPWTIFVGDALAGTAQQIWEAPQTLRGSYPSSDGGANLHWATSDRITFLSYQDGWPHLYSIKSEGGEPLLLTPGNFMAEYIKLSNDGKWLIFSANTGTDKFDIDRRHIARVPVDQAKMEVLTNGTGIEAFPVITGDGSTVAMISSTAQLPPLPAIMPFAANNGIKVIGKDFLPTDFPATKLITPKQITYKAGDGTTVHAQLFEPQNINSSSKKPAVVFAHGGPPRQMLLGWHHGDYYANTYAINQYLASLGFVVLSVNYRLGIGYGYEFQKPADAGANGASEYQDVKAGGEWLASRPDIDASRIGIYGGSYGGYLTALALGKDSKLFAAGVDVHGVHDWWYIYEGTKAPDTENAKKVVFNSSPIAFTNTWTSPVLFIHADDDRNVAFSQSVDLARRLDQKGLKYEQLVVPDDTHHWMKHSNQITVDKAIAEFLKRKLIK